jgi:hypothetical protein
VINLATNPTESIHTCCRVFANVRKVAQHQGFTFLGNDVHPTTISRAIFKPETL